MRKAICTLAALFVVVGNVASDAAGQGRGRSGRRVQGVYKDRITPYWFDDGTRFWYRNDLAGGTKEFILVDAESGTRQFAFDHDRLAAALSEATGETCQADRLPFDSIEFNGVAVRFKVGGTVRQCDLDSYRCARLANVQDISPGETPTQRRQRFEEITPETVADGTNLAYDPPLYEDSVSPDGKWTASIKDYNVVVRGADGQEVRLSDTGVEGHSFGMLSWSPDSKTFIASRIVPGEPKPVYLLESSPREGGRAKLRTRLYPLPGDKYTSYGLWVFDVASRRATKVETEIVDFYGPPQPRWRTDARRFLFHRTDRGHQRFRIIEVDTATGKTRTIFDDKAETFVNTTYDSFIYYTEGNEEILYTSERDGWKHLYLIDAERGGVKNQITKGPWVVRGVTRVDEAKRQIWFTGSGRNPDQDPYLIHHYHVNFDGTGLVALTEGNGSHSVQYSPDEKYLIDTYSRVDMAPVHELRRVSDGALVCALEKADISELVAGGWAPPEVFVAKGRDGETGIWGIISRPADFDPEKRYPVIEYIYAGPHSSYVPKTFRPTRQFASFTDVGFIVVQMDGMGTANRSKAFHDVCWHDLKDAGFPDRILWHQAVAKKYPYYDLDRVGIYGGSAGGQNAAGAVLFHHEFYQAAVASCGCHDNRMDKASWNEQWMGYPVGPWYAESSNIENAYRLQGKLMLIVGELDTNVPPESTLRFADALIKAGKDFDLVFVPGAGHGSGGAYGQRRMRDFFTRHLLGVEPPDRNAQIVAPASHP
ncbi:MAG: prolyl oligopeptidase family serine peptidase [Sedimentisphaerales bacterium]|nr:prolyl oligopeptidase family serine peptidase [Sedimentisphaerales bacterium]